MHRQSLDLDSFTRMDGGGKGSPLSEVNCLGSANHANKDLCDWSSDYSAGGGVSCSRAQVFSPETEYSRVNPATPMPVVCNSLPDPACLYNRGVVTCSNVVNHDSNRGCIHDVPVPLVCPNDYVCDSSIFVHDFHHDYCADPNLVDFASHADPIFDSMSGFDRYSKYEPVQLSPGLPIYRDRTYVHDIGGVRSQWNLPAWLWELGHENDSQLRDYLRFGVTHGFYIVDNDACIPEYECKNYRSATSGEAFAFIDSLITREVALGKYVVSATKPQCVHSLGAVPKKNGKWRPITDCRQPLGSSINNHMSSTFREFSYATVDQVIELVTPNCFMATVDISAAYRTVTVNPAHWKFQGVSWAINGVDTYLMDTHICFGPMRCAPYLFTQISNFVVRCLQRRGYGKVISYIDDYIVFGDTRESCLEAQQCLMELLGSLGFLVAWDKCSAPSQVVTYLGVEFNSSLMTVSLPAQKLSKLLHEIGFFIDRTRATKRQIQRLCGVLANAKSSRVAAFSPAGSLTCYGVCLMVTSGFVWGRIFVRTFVGGENSPPILMADS